ncbi:MAG: YbaK/EbsC family protein, partial [Nanoarchaeota archaeon]
FLDHHKITYQYFEHEPTPTSEIAAKLRGVALETGAKAMIIRSEGKFFMLVLPAHKKIDFGKVKTMLNSKSVSFATAEEVQKVTQCIPGGVPPFGNLFGIPVYMDRELLENTVINFNAGLQTVSIEMKVQDWLKIVNPIKTTFTKEY